MGFWIFMLVMDLLIPVTMVFIGKRFQKKPPKEINGIYGYRTAMSMKNKETGNTRITAVGSSGVVSGLVMLLPTVIAWFVFSEREMTAWGQLGESYAWHNVSRWLSNCIDRAGVKKMIRPEWKECEEN